MTSDALFGQSAEGDLFSAANFDDFAVCGPGEALTGTSVGLARDTVRESQSLRRSQKLRARRMVEADQRARGWL